MDHDYKIAAMGIFGGSALLIWGMAFCLKYFLGLMRRPFERTNLTVGIPYLLLSIGGLFFVPFSAYFLLSPLAIAPGGLLVYWFVYQEFKEKWVDDPSQLPEGIEPENEDWRVGIKALLVSAFLVGLAIGIRFLFRLLSGNIN